MMDVAFDVVGGQPSVDLEQEVVSPFRNQLAEFVYMRTYSRWLEDKGRRETWGETVDRYIDFLRTERTLPPQLLSQLRDAIFAQEVLPSMRALWSAGETARRDNTTLYNCSFNPIDSLKSFSEMLFILMCFHPETLVQVRGGTKKISEITPDDEVCSFNTETGEFSYIRPEKILCNPTSQKPKFELLFDDGSVVTCTEDHLFWTKNRGWVQAKDLTDGDDV